MSFFAKLFGLEKPVAHEEVTGALLTTANGAEELAAIEALLRGADIPYRLSDRGAGGVVRVISGYTMYGTDVFVRAEDVEAARELLMPADVIEEDPVEDEADGDTDEGEADGQ